MEENGRGLIGNGERFKGREGLESRAGKPEGPAIVGVSRSQMMASVHSLFHQAAPLLAPPHSVFIVELGGRATHNPTTPTLIIPPKKKKKESEKLGSRGFGGGGWRAFKQVAPFDFELCFARLQSFEYK